MGGIETTSPTTLLPERAPWALSSGRYLYCNPKTAKNKSQTSVARNICTSIKDKNDLQHLLGYEQWKNFKTVIDKTRTTCEVAGHNVSNHFADVGKTIKMPKGAEKTIDDFMLTGYTCYLIAQNSDLVISPITKTSGILYLKEASDREFCRPAKM